MKAIKFIPFVSVLFVPTVLGFDVKQTDSAPLIDGINNDSAWQNIAWRPINQLLLGAKPTAEDFSGQFKLTWTPEKLYLIAEITDDVLLDKYADPLELYWEDDSLEILLDENGSGGDHLTNYNAFAYHVALDNQSVDIDNTGKPRLFNDHVESKWQRDPATGNVIWELGITLYDESFDHNATKKPSPPETLFAGKNLSIMVAYCDADADDGRQSFVTSFDVEPVNGDKNRGYIDSSVFEPITLIK